MESRPNRWPKTIDKNTDVIVRAMILFDASDQVGLGHFSRALSLGRYMQQKDIKCDLVHLGVLSESLYCHLKSFCAPFRQNFSVAIGSDHLKKLISDNKFTHGLIDVSQNFDHDIWQIEKFFEGSILATFDDLTSFRKKADLCFYPPITNLSELDWNNYSGKVFSGFEYYIYRPELDEYTRRSSLNHEYDICITCGGANNASLTEKVLDILGSYNFNKVLVILGPMSRFHYDETKLSNVEVVVSPENYIELIIKSRLIINTYGVSVFELFYLEKDAITICLEADHTESAKMFSIEKNLSFIDISEVDDRLLNLANEKINKQNENRTSKPKFSLNEQIYLELKKAS